MKKIILQSGRIFLTLTVLTGIFYPLIVTIAGRVAFPRAAEGSLIREGDRIIGSELLAQNFQRAQYFWPRPSGADFATVPSGASNAGPTSQALKDSIDKRTQALMQAHEIKDASLIPADLLMASGSGLDPHISVEAANFQLNRVLKARNLSTRRQDVERLIANSTEGPTFGFLGESRVNVLLLNRKLDALP